VPTRGASATNPLTLPPVGENRGGRPPHARQASRIDHGVDGLVSRHNRDRRATLVTKGNDTMAHPASLIQDADPSIFERALPLLLVGFVFLDRGFAWLHIPGTPIFTTEIVLIIGLSAVVRGMARPLVWTRTSTIVLLVAFLAWG